MFFNFKKIILIVIVVIIAGLIGFALYYMFTKTAPIQKTTETGEVTPSGQLPSSGEMPAGATGAETEGEIPSGQLPSGISVPGAGSASYYQPKAVIKISDDYAVHSSLNSKNGNYRYYNSGNGKFYRVQADGTIKELTDQVFYNVKNVTWAKNNDKAVLEYPDGSKIIYNFEIKKQVTLPKHWEEFSFSSDGTQVAAKSIGLSPENRWLVTINDDGTGTKLVEPMGNNADRVQIAWSPSNQTVAFSQTGEPLGAERREVLFVGLNNENFKSTIVEGMGFTPQWSNTGKKLLYSVYSSRTDYKPEIWVVNSYGDEIGSDRQELKINTWADKCAFGDDNTLFCAIPQNLPRGAGMSREIANSSYDTLYKIDLKTGLKTNIPLEENYNIQNISYDQSNNKLFFNDLNKNGIFEAQL
ncbi:MAG: hypothetical protein PHY40_02570 [Patescibacteria group bacterium]|nr:hypothetical protein [Patescibacteria group bacterium]